MNESPEQTPSPQDETAPDTPAPAPFLEPLEPLEPIEPAAPAPLLSTRQNLALAGFGVAYVLMFILGGEFRTFAVTGLFALPFMALVVLAYSAEVRSGWRNGVTLAYWITLIGLTGILSAGFTIAAIAIPAIGPVTDFDPEAVKAASEQFPTLEHGIRILASIVALLAAGVISLAFFLPAVRRAAAKFFDINPQSFVHATALATVFAITLMSLIPLLAVGDPPLLPMLLMGGTTNLPPPDEQLRSTFYSLIWAVPGAFLAVGYPFTRTVRQARERLGLDRPRIRHLIFSVAMTAVLLGLIPLMGEGIDRLWKVLGWPTTDQEAIKMLFGFATGPVGAFIASLVAGLGEELVFRGVLQPRLGILLPALMFTSVHAFQYNFDALVLVFFLGVIFGVVRKQTNTTTSAIIHFGYDFVLLATAIE